MINIQKYNSLNDYLQDQSRPAGECAVSQIGNTIKYDGVNVILKENQLNEDSVCSVFIDTLTGEMSPSRRSALQSLTLRATPSRTMSCSG